MALRSRLLGDEELGSSKRDDDFPRKQKPSREWIFKRPPWMRKWRMAALFAFLFAIAFFVYQQAWDSTLQSQGQPQARTGRARTGSSFMDRAWARQYDPNTPQEAPNAPPRGARPPGAPGSAKTTLNEQPSALDFDGPVRFYYLAASLHGIARTEGHKTGNRNVLFAASDLQAAAQIIPLACEMARWKLNYVHFAFMGRDELSLDEVKRLNNAQHKSTCDVYWHDARPDYAAYSTDRRMETSVAGALAHIDMFMHPQAIITAGPEAEDDFFSRSTAKKTRDLRQTLVEIPSSELESLSWITRLEAKALHNWHIATIDILVQAPQETSGSLIRLLKSLSRAQYGAFNPPRLTIELPQKVHKDTMNFINDFIWPPFPYQPSRLTNELVLRRRIPDTRMSEDESSMRFVESFYPTHTQNAHVLVLSPQAELSPAFFHYLKYHLLEWRYGDLQSDELMGIALETPSAHLNGTGSFVPPKPPHPNKNDEVTVTSFLWQAPNSNAALFFADKWTEFHSFLTGVTLSRRHPRTRDVATQSPKLLSKRYPAWTEHMLEFMRARGYFLAFPSPREDASQGTSPAIIHNELFQAPEEWFKPREKKPETVPDIDDNDVLEAPGDYLSTHHKSVEEDSLNVERDLLRSLHHILTPAPAAKNINPDDDDPNLLPDPIASLNELALLDYTGADRHIDDLVGQSDEYAVSFRRNIGGCDEKRANVEAITIGQVDDLFCLEDFDGDTQGSPVKGAGSNENTAPQHAESQRPVGAEARKKEHAEHPKDHIEHAASGPKTGGKLNMPPRPEGYVAGGSGAAKSVAAVADAAHYSETAIAGMKAKQAEAEGKEAPPAPAPASGPKAGSTKGEADDGLTDLQRSELDDWKAKQRKVAGEIPNEPKQTHERKVTATEDILETAPTLDPKKALQNEEFLDQKAGESASDPDDIRAKSAKPVKAAAQQKPGGGAAPVDEDGSEPKKAPARAATKGRLRGWDEGGFDENVRDERAAAAGMVKAGTGREEQRGA